MENLLKLEQPTIQLLNEEFASIPDKYQKFFNSTHEGYAVLLEEVRELEDEIFFGEKRHKKIVEWSMNANPAQVGKPSVSEHEAKQAHKQAIRKEAIQVAAMAIRVAQELTYDK